MKKYFTLIVCSLASACLSYASNFNSSDEQRIPLEITKDITEKHGYEFERTCTQPIITAYYNPDASTIECEVYKIGIVNIYIIDITGSILDYVISETEVPTIVPLSTASSNSSFYIIIESELIYAEGYICQ